MGCPCSLDLRERVVTAMTAGMSGREAAKHFSIGESTALRWARRARETGSPKARPMGGTRRFVLEAHRHWITARLVEKPDLTLRAGGGTEGAWRQRQFVRCLEYCRRCWASFKKSLHASEQDRPDVARRRRQ